MLCSSQPLLFWKGMKGGRDITSPNFVFGRTIQRAKNENQVAETQLVGR